MSHCSSIFNLSIHLSVNWSFNWSLILSLKLSIHWSFHWSVHWSFHLSFNLSFHLPIHWFINGSILTFPIFRWSIFHLTKLKLSQIVCWHIFLRLPHIIFAFLSVWTLLVTFRVVFPSIPSIMSIILVVFFLISQIWVLFPLIWLSFRLPSIKIWFFFFKIISLLPFVVRFQFFLISSSIVSLPLFRILFIFVSFFHIWLKFVILFVVISLIFIILCGSSINRILLPWQLYRMLSMIEIEICLIWVALGSLVWVPFSFKLVIFLGVHLSIGFCRSFHEAIGEFSLLFSVLRLKRIGIVIFLLVLPFVLFQICWSLIRLFRSFPVIMKSIFFLLVVFKAASDWPSSGYYSVLRADCPVMFVIHQLIIISILTINLYQK